MSYKWQMPDIADGTSRKGLIIDKLQMLSALFVTLLIVVGQSVEFLLLSQIFRAVVTVGTLLLILINGSWTIFFLGLGFFVPQILGASNTILPQTYFFYFVVMILSLGMQKRKSTFHEQGRYLTKSNIAFYIAFLLTVLQADLLAETYELELNTFLSYTMGLLGALAIRTKKDEDKILYTLILISFIFSGWVVFGTAEYSAISKRYEVGFDQNYLTFFIGFGLLITVTIIMNISFKKHLFMAIIIIFGIILNIAAVLMLGSRGIIIAMSISLIAIVSRQIRLRQNILYIIAILSVLIIALTQLPAADIIMTRFQDKDEMQSASYRITLAYKAWEHFVSAPLLDQIAGSGTNSSMQTLSGIVLNVATSPHNQFIEFALDYGIAGMICFIWLFVLGVKNIQGDQGYYGTIRLGLLIYLLISSLSLTPFKLSALPWIALGLTLTRLQPVLLKSKNSSIKHKEGFKR